VASPPDPHRWLALTVVLIASFMDLLDIAIVNVAIPSIQRNLNAGYAQIQWIVAGYALAFAVVLITGGRLGDIFGRKRLFLIGMTGFTIGSALCGTAVNPGMLIGSRFLQGTMAGLMIPQVLAIIHVTFPPEERGKVFGVYGGMAGSASVAGPVLGGLLVQWNLAGWQWRPIFLVNVPVGVAGLIMAWFVVRESKAPGVTRLDIPGMVLATAAIGMLVYPLTEGHDLGWPAWTFALMGGSVPVFVLFVACQRRRARAGGSGGSSPRASTVPLVVLSLFRHRSFTAGLGVSALFWLAFGGFFLTWMLYLQAGLGWTPLHAGLTAIAFAVPTAAAAGASVQLLTPTFGRKVLMAGAVAAGAGFGLYIFVSAHYGTAIHSWQMIAPLAITGIGFGLIVSPLVDLVLSGVPRGDAGSASGLLNTVQQLGIALGIALIGTIFFDQLTVSRSFTNAFGLTLWSDVGAMALVFLLMFALPRRAAAAWLGRGHATNGSPPSSLTMGRPATAQPVMPSATLTVVQPSLASTCAAYADRAPLRQIR
jgi:EmrB/QacA subfamily drug resistance transporter